MNDFEQIAVELQIYCAKSRQRRRAMKSKTVWKQNWQVIMLGAVCLALTLSTSAQVETKTTTTSSAPSVETQVQRGEVVTVSGNDLVVKMEDGSLRHIANVP